jgi:hypothetical protein
MVGLSERLAFILTLDADGAIRGFQRVGKEADKSLGKADARLEKLGHTMTKFGAGAVAASGVAAVGLFGLAKASEEARLSEVKLDNTLANMPKLAGANKQAFLDLADAIQSKTAADGDAIVAAQAMLGTFRLTQGQILDVTPLVVDYARKFGVDLVSAATQVGKALDGQIGALKRNGVSIDENLFKTDKYAAVTQALRDQVGGFAEQEGKTMAGQLARLKNEMGDIAEGVGVGVVAAFGDMSGAVFGAVDAVGGLNEETLAGAGQFATYGTAALGVVGSLSFVAGQAIKLRDRFTVLGEDGTRSVNNLGKAAGSLGGILVAGGVIAAAYELGQAFDDGNKFAESFASGLSTVEVALSRVTQIVDDNNDAMARHIKEAPDYTRETLEQALATKNLEENLDQLSKILETGNIVAASRYRDAMGEAGLSTEEATQRIEEHTAAAKQNKADMEATAAIIGESADASDDDADSKRRQTDATYDAADAARAQAAALRETWAASDRADDLEEAVAGFNEALNDTADTGGRAAKAIDRVAEKQKAVDAASKDAERALRAHQDAVEAVADANDDLVKAQKALEKALKGPTVEDRTDAENELTDARLSAEDANDAVTDAQEKYNEKVAEFGPTSDEARRALNDLNQAKQRAKQAANDVTVAQTALNDVYGWTAETAPEVAAAQDAVAEAEKRVAAATQNVKDRWVEFNDAARKSDETVNASLSTFGASDGALRSNRDRADELAQAYLRVRDSIRQIIAAKLEEQIAGTTKVADLQDLYLRVKSMPGLSDQQRAELLGAIEAGIVAARPGGGRSSGSPGVPGYATGGVVPGPMGAPQLAVVHGGEQVLTPAQRGGGGGIAIYNYGVMAGPDAERWLIDTIASAQRRGLVA